MKTRLSNPKRNRWLWSGINFISILAMLAAMAVPTPTVHAQAPGGSAPAISSQMNGVLLDNKKSQTCQQGGSCALHFNGVNQWVEENQFRGFDTSAFTVETWFNWSDGGKPISSEGTWLNGQIPLIAIGAGNAPSTFQDLKLLLSIESTSNRVSGGFIGLPAGSTGESQAFTVTGNTDVTTGEWHHVALTYDGQTLQLFLDGTLDAENVLSDPIVPDLMGVRNVTIAAALPGIEKGLGFYKGALDEVRIWEIARTQTELTEAANAETISDPNLIGYWMMNEGKGSEVKDGSGKGNRGLLQNSPTWIDGPALLLMAVTPEATQLPSIDAVPNAPTLVAPLDAQTNVSTSPNLQVNVSDSVPTNLTVTFYGKAALAPRPDFTIIALPDTQKYAVNGLGIFGLQTQWVVAQQAQRNIVFVGHLGDMGDDWNVPFEWDIVSAAMRTLDNAGIPYGIGPGNCDLDNWGAPPNTTFFNTYFPVSRFAGKPFYGGSYPANDTANSYQLVSASGLNFIIIEIKYNVSYNTTQGNAILSWADNLLKTYSNRRAIIITHYLLETNNTFSADGSMIYNALKGNPNLFLMLGGHFDTEGMRTDLGTDGHTIYSLRSDYQTRANGGNGWLRIMRFSPDSNKIYITTYSPYLNQFETDASSQFDLNYNMGGTGFDTLGSVTVPSGSTASLNWPGLTSQTQYQWYVTVSDGTSTTTSSTWSFTTSGGQAAPVVTTQPASLTVTSGQSASFTAEASGSPTPTVQWQVSTNNGSTWSDIASATSMTYSFTTATADNGKQFRAVFTNASGSATTSAATLTVNSAPAITAQPASITVSAGQSATFTSAASGTPSPVVQWQVSKDGGSTWTNIAGATSTTYSFITTTSDNGNQFRAVFTNTAGSVTSNAAMLTVNFAPTVTVQPANQTVSAGQSASFTSSASGNPTPTVQWQTSSDNGITWNNITGATSLTYAFTAASGDNGRLYRAVFTNSVGTATSSSALLTVNTGPVITLQPANVTVNAGQSATFTAAASGIPSPTVQWQVSTNGTTWANIPGATTTTYSFTTVSGDNGKQFRAVFTNTAGSATTNAALLTVYTAPVITSQPTNQTVTAGQSASFTAAASGSPTPTIQWQKSTDNGVSWTDIAGASSTNYSFTTVSADNGNQYRAVFSNAAGTATTNAAILTVNTLPAVSTQPASLTVTAGQTASFTSTASGSPAPTVQWQVSTNSGTTWTNITGAVSTTYSFTAQAADNAKQYRAVFTNSAGTATSTAAVLTVNTVPAITTHPSALTVNEGQTASFTAAATGNPAPTVQWQVSTNSGTTWTNITGAVSTTYSFTAQAADNGKQFRAVFSNTAGSATSYPATLTVQTAPVITLQPISQTIVLGKSVTFTAAASGNPAPAVQWQSSADGITWSSISSATSATYSFTPAAGDNGKQFRAVFTNSVASATSSPASLTVNYPPEITLQPANQNLIAGQTAPFNAAVNSNPVSTVQWQSSSDGVLWTNIAGATSATLSFTVQLADNGKQYHAVFTNPVGSATTNAALLSVNSGSVAPVVTLNPADQTVIAGQTATFSASASGTPVPTIQWQVSVNGTTWTDITGATSSPFSLITQSSDNGKQYRATFTNAAGTATSSAAHLTVNTAPAVVSNPANLTLNAGQTAAFSASASGTPAPTMQWQVSTDGIVWTDLAGATTSPLSFTAQATDNGKQYRAVFSNAAGSASTNAASLTVYTAPVITSQPGPQTVTAGQTATFTADATGNPIPTAQWQVSTDAGVSWTNITGATSRTYSFTAGAADNGKRYRAVFSNTAGSANSNAAILTVNTVPVITTHPAALTVNAGQTASFSAAASGSPAPTVQWQTSSDGITWIDISGATSATYSFITQAGDNGRQYQAVFRNAAGSATSNSAVLIVQYAPAINTQPSDQTVTFGQAVTFSASASGNPTPSVQWQVSLDGTTWSNIAGATSASYTYSPQISDNGKRYHAVFTNLVGSATSTSALLTVQYAPQISQHPLTQTVTAGQPVTFSAAASGNPSPTVQWQLSTNNGATWSNIAGATASTYSFTTGAADNGEQYRAVFTNSVGAAASNAAILTVLFAPTLTSQPTSQMAAVGQTVTFSASADGNPMPTVQWQSSPDGTTWSNIAGAAGNTYSFIAQAVDNGKSFRAVFSNSVGTANSNAALLTVAVDLIFKDGFNTCNAAAWNGGATNLSRLAFNTASGRNSTCGMAVTIVNSTAAFVTDNNPNNEKTLNARLYFNPNTLKMPNNTALTLFVGSNSSLVPVVNLQIRILGNTWQVRAGALNDTSAWVYTNWVTFNNTWHAFEVDWSASSSATANDGALTLYVDGVQVGSVTGINNDVHSVSSVSVGAIAGMTNKMSGSFFIDDYESRRLTYIGQ